MGADGKAELLEDAPPDGGAASAPATAESRWRVLSARSMLVAVVMAAGLGLGAGVLIGEGGRPDSHAARSKAHEAAQRTVTRTSEQGPISDPAQRRKALEGELEASIERDGRILLGAHYLEGPIVGSTCTLMGAIESTAKGVVGHYNCMAIKRRIPNLFKEAPPTLEGARFFGTINFTANTYTYRGD